MQKQIYIYVCVYTCHYFYQEDTEQLHSNNNLLLPTVSSQFTTTKYRYNNCMYTCVYLCLYKKIVGVENKVNQNKLNPQEEENININLFKCIYIHGCKYSCKYMFRVRHRKSYLKRDVLQLHLLYVMIGLLQFEHLCFNLVGPRQKNEPTVGPYGLVVHLDF